MDNGQGQDMEPGHSWAWNTGPSPLILSSLFPIEPEPPLDGDGRDMTLLRSAGGVHLFVLCAQVRWWVTSDLVFCALIEVYPSFRVRARTRTRQQGVVKVYPYSVTG